MAKELSQTISPAQKIEGREASDRKEEEEKKEMGPAVEKKEEEDKDSEVKDEKSGTDQSRGKKDGRSGKGFLRPGLITDREKATEEKEKDKETLTAAETADAKAKSEVLDLKKGVSEPKLGLAHAQSCIYTNVKQTKHNSIITLGFRGGPSLSGPSLTHPSPVREAN